MDGQIQQKLKINNPLETSIHAHTLTERLTEELIKSLLFRQNKERDKHHATAFLAKQIRYHMVKY